MTALLTDLERAETVEELAATVRVRSRYTGRLNQRTREQAAGVDVPEVWLAKLRYQVGVCDWWVSRYEERLAA